MFPELRSTSNGNTLIKIDEFYFDAQAWVAGEPLGQKHPWGISTPNQVIRISSRQLKSLCKFIAEFHASVSSLPIQDFSVETILVERLGEIINELPEDQFHLRKQLESTAMQKMVVVKW